MDLGDKIRELKNDIEKLTNEEQAIKGRLVDLKRLNEERIKRLESIAKLKASEEQLLKELNLI